MRAYHHQHPQTPTIDVGQMTKMQNVNMTLGKSRVYLLIDTVLSVRFDLGRKKRRVPNNLGQQWPVRLSPIPQKIKEANVRQCIAPPLQKRDFLDVTGNAEAVVGRVNYASALPLNFIAIFCCCTAALY